MRKSIILISALSLLVCCTTKQETSMPEAPPVPVIAAAPTIEDITVFVDSIGTLHPDVLSEIRPQINGTLQDVLIAEGQSVQKGTPLFRIDDKFYEIRLQEAQAQLDMDKANYLAIQKKMNRFKDLAQKDLVAQTEWDEIESQAEMSFASITLDEARLNSAKYDLDHCTLLSPIEGRVGKLDAHPGLLVAAGQTSPLVTISKMDPLTVEFTVTEKEFAKMPENPTTIELQSLSTAEPYKNATLSFMDNHFDQKTGLLLIRGKIQNPDYTLRPGQSVRVRIPIATLSNAKLIPQKAIRYNQEGPYAYVVQKDMTVAIRQLVLGSEQGIHQIVLEGLDPEEQIILDGHLRLSPGLKVEIKS